MGFYMLLFSKIWMPLFYLKIYHGLSITIKKTFQKYGIFCFYEDFYKLKMLSNLELHVINEQCIRIISSYFLNPAWKNLKLALV